MNLTFITLTKWFHHTLHKPRHKYRDLLCWTILFIFIVMCGCGHALKRQLTAPVQFQSLDSSSPFLKAHMPDGKVYILSSWKIDSENQTVTGQGEVFNTNREILETGGFTIPIDSVAIFETNTQYIPPGVKTEMFTRIVIRIVIEVVGAAMLAVVQLLSSI